ncbi:hypothetical protein LWI29_000163 [Acer saccharum]|uniref:Glucose/Sorbosone dehydrogenase domain-containing protein n=1 Tax=Acer saccharum TaxID=4024 RepID=A0AA39RGJ0_ACESA|nr:hypothetical protein LWI29_000163 [Acer saccharum]
MLHLVIIHNTFRSHTLSYLRANSILQDEYEEVDIITKGGNYGWNVYEGPFLFNSSHSSAISMDLIFPVLGYKHSDVNNNVSASICGGYLYRSMTDPCLYGSCAHDSPIQCKFVPESSLPDLRYIYSFGEDNRKEIYVLANNGVYRVVRPSRCNYTCPKEIVKVVSSQISSSSSRRNHFTYPNGELMLLLSSLLHVLGTIL